LQKCTSTGEIVNHFEKKGFTKQGVYKVLGQLQKDEKILWVKTSVEIHLMWLHKEIDKLASALPRKELVFEEFSSGKAIYHAKTLTELEQIYGQIFISLISTLEGSVKNFLFHDVHNYTYVNTVPIVDWYIDFIIRNRGTIYLLVGSTSLLDRELKKKNKMRSIHIHCADTKLTASYSIFGDNVITVTLAKKVQEKINEIFETCSEKEASPQLQKLYETKGRHKIVVEKNPKKARLLEKEFKKYFPIK
jgi:hypothetical protein